MPAVRGAPLGDSATVNVPLLHQKSGEKELGRRNHDPGPCKIFFIFAISLLIIVLILKKRERNEARDMSNVMPNLKLLFFWCRFGLVRNSLYRMCNDRGGLLGII